MRKTAVLWIRDGVLIDRMPVNAVAFAVASLAFADPSTRAQTDLTTLVQFAFDTSGIACAEKMVKFNREQVHLIDDVPAAANYYNNLSGTAAASCCYMDGICELIESLAQKGVLNFITSAVEQTVLDRWAESPQAAPVATHLTEILGRRGDGFIKGRDHFEHVCNKYGVEQILYVADAVSEISTGAKFASEFNIIPIGFAHVIEAAAVEAALERVLLAHSQVLRHSSMISGALDIGSLHLPAEAGLVTVLRNAGARAVGSGDARTITRNLTVCLDEWLK